MTLRSAGVSWDICSRKRPWKRRRCRLTVLETDVDQLCRREKLSDSVPQRCFQQTHGFSRFVRTRKRRARRATSIRRCAHLDGACVHDAIGRHFLGSNGKLRPYKWSDFNYDVATGWIFLEVNASDVSDAGQLEALTAHARSLLKPANPKVSMRQTMSDSMAFVAMRDLKWKPYLKGKDAEHVKKCARHRALSAVEHHGSLGLTESSDQ